jgi:predicted alpha-1,2-mannosidase
MPGTGGAKLQPGSRENPDRGYRSRFSHQDEIAEPGYYSVLLRDYNIRAELTATERAGMHRYTFPQSDTTHFIVDLFHANNLNKSIMNAELRIVGNDTIVGSRTVGQWAAGRQIFFAMKFSKPFDSTELFSDDKAISTKDAKGTCLKALIHHATAVNETILVKTGISGVSIDGALKNLATEIPAWDFDQVRRNARFAWLRELSRVRITTADLKQKQIFYTALYHALLAPTLFDDVDGQYRGMEDKIHQLTSGLHNYSTFSLWDTYRTTHPLYTLVQQKRVPDMVNCLIRMAEESPAGPPVWPLHARETGCMVGYHSAPVIAEAFTKKFPNIDFARAYRAFKKRAMQDDYRGLGAYRKFGYIPCDLEEESASKTLDYAYDDWAVSRMARAAGEDNAAEALEKRSRDYRNLFDSNTGFIRPRLSNGNWAAPFDPRAISTSKKWRDYTESNGWQTTFCVQHDPQGLINLFGSRDAFIRKLDALFDQSSELPLDTPPDVAGLVGMYAHGNEPSHHIAFLYTYAGAPYKTQERVRHLLDKMYDNQPDGLAGNEDCGQMSAWYIMSALGIYPVDPVSGNYVFAAPLFDRAEIQLDNGRQLTIETRRTSPADKYIHSVTLNGKPLTRAWVSHAELAAGAHLVFTMAAGPNRSFASDEPSAPASMPTI